jgi:tetratricopeptide (TPR) repeat protein
MMFRHLHEHSLIEVEPEFDKLSYTHVLPQNYKYPSELTKIRRLIHRQLWNAACVEIETYDPNSLRDETKPVFQYLRGRVFRMLFENDNNKEYASDGRLSDTCAASDFLAQAVKSYRAVADGYPGHFLADDALGWLGGCAYRSGNYVQALQFYLQLLEKYPRSDVTIRYVSTDIGLTISGVLKAWSRMNRADQERFLELLRGSRVFGDPSALPDAADVRLPETIWGTLAREDVQRLLNVLRSTGQLNGFLKSSGGTWQIVHSISLVEVPMPDVGRLPVEGKEHTSEAHVSPYLSSLISRLYYSGRFAEAKRVLDDVWTYLGDDAREELSTYYWCSAVNSMGSTGALKLAADKGWRNAAAAIAYDFTNIDELRALCDDRAATFADIFSIILADRLAASGDFVKAIDRLFLMISEHPDSLYVDAGCLQILRIAYFLLLNEPQAEWAGSSVFHGLGEEEHLALFRSFESSFFGDEFVLRNRELLDDLYRQSVVLGHFIWGWRQNFYNYRSIRSDYVTRAGRLMLQIRTSPDFNRIPASSQRVVLDLLQFTNLANNLIRQKYVYEENFLRETLVPYMRARHIRGMTELEQQVLPMLVYLWNVMHMGKFEPTKEDTGEYQLLQKCDYLLNREGVFRTIHVSDHDWNSEAYLLTYRMHHEHGLPLLLGTNYELGAGNLSATTRSKTLSRHQQLAYLTCLQCIDRYAAQVSKAHMTWVSVLLNVSRANLNFSFDVNDLLERHDLSPWGQESREIRHTLPGRYAEFLARFPDSRYSERVARLMANAYEDIGNTGLAQRIRTEWDVQQEVPRPKRGLPPQHLGRDLPVATEESGDIISLKAAVALLLGEYDVVRDLTHSIRRDPALPRRGYSVYLCARSHLSAGRTAEGLEDLIGYIRDYPSSDEIPFVLEDAVRAVGAGGERCSTLGTRLCRELDSLTGQMTHFMNVYFFLVARFKLALALQDTEGALDAGRRLIAEDYPTRNIGQVVGELAEHPLLSGIDNQGIMEALRTSVRRKYYYYYGGSLHAMTTRPENGRSETE